MSKREVYPGIIRSCSRRGSELWLVWDAWYRTGETSIGIEVVAHSFYKQGTLQRVTEVEPHWWHDGKCRCTVRNQVPVADLIAVRNWIDWIISQALYGLPYRAKLIVKAEERDEQKDVRRRLYRRWGKRWAPYADVIYR